MVNNSTKYQQIEQPPLTSNNWTQNKTSTYDVENPGLDIWKSPKCGWHKQNILSETNTGSS